MDALDKYPYSKAILMNLAVIMMIQGNHVEAVLILKKMQRCSPDNMYILHNMIFALLMDGWYKDSYDYFRELIDGVKDEEMNDTQKLVKFSLDNYSNVIELGVESEGFTI